MKDYYDILGVNRNASIAEIKHSFRRLAIMYHPDRNSTKEAEGIIKDVIEAYQVLEDPIQRSLYDSLLIKSEPSEIPLSRSGKPHRDPRYRTKSKNPNYKSEKDKTIELMQSYMPWSIFISRFTLLVCLVLSFDFTLPPKTEKEVITGLGVATKYGDNTVLMEDGNKFSIRRSDLSKLRGISSITLSFSRLLKIPLSIRHDNSTDSIRVPATIYGNFIFIPFILSVTSILGVLWKKGVVFRFNLGIVNAVLVFLTVLLLMFQHLNTR